MPVILSRRTALLLPLLAALPSRAVFGADEEWRPKRVVKIIVPSTAGGTTDIMARLLAAHLQPLWGGPPVIVENKPGAGGAIGTQEVLRAAADGHTILMGNVGPQAIAYSLVRNLPYKAEDLVPVSNMILGPNALVVNPALPVNTVAELVEYLKKNPGKTSYGTPGIGQSPHLAGIWFNQLTGTESTAAHYRGAAPAGTDLAAGVIQYMFDALVNAVEPMKAGTVKVLAVSGRERYPTLPNIPTLREAMPELADFSVTSWVGVFVKKGTPPTALRALNTGINSLLERPATRERFLGMGGLPDYGTPEEYSAFINAEIAKYAQVIKRAGIQIDLG